MAQSETPARSTSEGGLTITVKLDPSLAQSETPARSTSEGGLALTIKLDPDNIHEYTKAPSTHLDADADSETSPKGATNDDNRSVDLSIQTGGPEGRYLEIIANDRTGTNAFVSQLEFLNTNLTIDDTVGLTLNFLINYDQDNDLPFGFHPIISDAYHVGDSIFYSGDEPEDYSPRRLARFFHFPSQEDGQSDWRVISIPVNTKSINWATWSNGPGLERGIWDFSFIKHLSFAVNLGGFTEAAEGTIGIDVIWFQKGTPDGATSILNQP